MKKLTNIDFLSLVKFQTVMLTFFGLVLGVIYAIGGLIVDTMVTLGWASGEKWETPGLSYGTVMALGALWGMPLIGAALGFALGLFEAVLYRLYARLFGGLRADLE
jgi:hypothetical protein